MSNRRVTVIILCWNRWDLTQRCLSTIRTHTDLALAEILVVDNGSTDATPRELKRYDWLRVLRNDRNLGFVRGNNVGIAASDRVTDVILLNNDVEITQSDWIDRLQATAHAAPDVGVVGCRLVLPDGRLLHAGTYILGDTLWGQQIGSGEVDVRQYGFDREVQGIVFACAYLKREVIDAIGGLSEAYESYFEDTDYCLRARQAGFRTMCTGSVTLIHREHGSTANEPGMFERVFQRSRAEFRQRWQSTLDQRYQRDLSWQSIMNFPNGYAMSCRELLRGLDSAGVRVAYSYVYGKGTSFPVDEPENSGDYLLNVLRGRRAPSRPPISVVYGQGDAFWRNRGQYRVGFTMLEVSGFPPEWVRQAKQMDELWVPSEFNREALLKSGVNRPIHIVPLGVDIDHFHPGIANRPNPDGDFVFMANFEWGERKCPELLMQTFNRVFRRSEPVVLACKIMNRDPEVNVRQRIEALGLRHSGGRIGILHNREFPYHQLGMLYRSADCYVSAGRGEGWDMPLMEAMASGLATIATDWGAHKEFVHDDISYPLQIRGTIPAIAKCPYYKGFEWADPDPEHLGVLLRQVYENRQEAALKGRLAAERMRARWTWAHAASRIVERLETIGS